MFPGILLPSLPSLRGCKIFETFLGMEEEIKVKRRQLTKGGIRGNGMEQGEY
jgi:hypothetical protein